MERDTNEKREEGKRRERLKGRRKRGESSHLHQRFTDSKSQDLTQSKV